MLGVVRSVFLHFLGHGEGQRCVVVVIVLCFLDLVFVFFQRYPPHHTTRSECGIVCMYTIDSSGTYMYLQYAVSANPSE